MLYRAYPSGPIAVLRFRTSRSGRYFGTSPYCLAPSGSSLEEGGALTSSLRCVSYETMGILANFLHFVKRNVVYKNRYANFTNRSLSQMGIWYNMTTRERGWGKPMPGEYSWMMGRRTRDTSPAEPRSVGTTQVNTKESPDETSGLCLFT